MNKKTFNIILAVCLGLLLFPIISIISIVVPYIKSFIIYGFARDFLKIVIIYILIILILCLIFAALIFLLVKGNKEEIKSVAIDFSARRTKKKRAKTEAKKERLKAELEELENDDKRTLD